MHDRTAGEVDGLDAGRGVEAVHETARTPNHVGHREVNDQHPEEDEQQHGAVLHAFGDGADDEGRGDDREHQLEHGEHGVGDGESRGVSGHAGLFSNAAETFKIAQQFLAEETILLKPETNLKVNYQH